MASSYLAYAYKQGHHDGLLGGPLRYFCEDKRERQAYHDGYQAGVAERLKKIESGQEIAYTGSLPQDTANSEPVPIAEIDRSSTMLEQKIDDLKKSIDTLNETLRAGMEQAAKASGTSTEAAATEKPAARRGSTKAAAKETPAATEPATPFCTYEELRAQLLKIPAAKGDAALVALLNEFNAKSGKDIKVEDYENVFKRSEEILGEGKSSGSDDLL